MTIDTRDLQEEIDDLEAQIEDLEDEIESKETEIEELQAELDGKASDLSDATEVEEIYAIKAAGDELQEQIETLREDIAGIQSQINLLKEEDLDPILELKNDMSHSEWKDGVTLIPEGEFEDYARELAEELGAVDTDTWPGRCIDWELAAHELAADYSCVTFRDEDYLYRS